MKNSLKLILFASAALFCACKDDDHDITPTPAPGPVVEEFTAFSEAYTIEGTKSQLGDSSKVIWEDDDAFSVWGVSSVVSGKYRVLAGGAESSALVLISPKDSVHIANANVALFPYGDGIVCTEKDSTYTFTGIEVPAIQTGLSDSFANGAAPAVAVASDTISPSLHFKNLLGVIKLTLKTPKDTTSTVVVTDTVKSVVLSGNENEIIAGSATVTANAKDNPVLTLTGLDKSITLTCGTGVEVTPEGSDFYIALAPQSFVKGFSVIVEKKSGNDTLSIDEAKSVTRSVILPVELTLKADSTVVTP